MHTAETSTVKACCWRADWSKPTFTIIQPPPNVTGSLHLGHAVLPVVVATPAEVAGIPAEEIGAPVFQHLPVLPVAASPAAGDGIAKEVRVDMTRARLLQQLLVRQHRV